MIAANLTTVVIADDQPLLREGLRRLLEEEPDLQIVGEAKDGQEVVTKVVERAPNVVVLDIHMPGTSGLQAARKLRAKAPATAIVMLTVHDTEEYVYEALKAGVKGYVLKDAAPKDLADAIRAASRGESYLSPSVAKLVVEPTAEGAEVQMVSQRLTKREREVCRMLAMGYTVPEIAGIIGISRKTVDVHKTRLMKKLDVHNRAELVRFALQNNMLED